MNLIQLQGGYKAFGPRTLFEDATFSINVGEKVGVIGPNGAGKSTLFKILAESDTLDKGQVIRSGALRLGYLAQEVEWREDETLREYLSPCITPLWQLKEQAKELGLTPEYFDRPIRSLSGGYRMRCKLLYLWGFEPNLMLLDEPTNYLDLETLFVLERFLGRYDGAFLVISHDREFLKRTTNYTLEVENGDINKFSGNVEAYFEQKALLDEQERRAALSVAAKRKAILDFAARFGASATKASQVQSRLKGLKRLEPIEVRALPVRARIKIPQPERISRQVIQIKEGQLGYRERVILRDVHVRLERESKVGIVGYNGAGKSTLLKSLAGEIPLIHGERSSGNDVSIGYYAQHVSESLNPADSVYESLEATAHPSVTPQEILEMGGALLFSGDLIHKKVAVLSGGERARVALGQIFLKRVSVLLLDEVTNHLDFDTVEALTQALERYSGTVVLVSHDRSFVRRVATSILEVEHGRVSTYPGTYDEYVWSVEQREEPIPAGPAPTERAHETQERVPKRNLKELQKSITSIEKEIKSKTRIQETLNSRLLTEEGQRDSASIAKQLAENQIEIAALENLWIEVQEEIENFQK